MPSTPAAQTAAEREPDSTETQRPSLELLPTAPEPAGTQHADELAHARRAAARQAREQNNYRHRLTKKLFDKLEALLNERTPDEFVDDGSENAATRMLHYQSDVMDDVLGKPHWRLLTHYEDDGATVRVFVVIGNRLASVKLDSATGDLIAAKPAEILMAEDAWGGQLSSSKGNTLMAGRTAVAKRLLAQVGPGRDGLSRPRPRAQGREDIREHTPNLTAVAGAGERKATDLEVKDLASIIRRRDLPSSQVANLIRRADGQPPVNYRSEESARQYVARILSDRKIVLAAALVAPLRLLLEQAEPEQPLPGRDSPHASGRADGQTVRFEPGTQVEAA